MSLHRVFSLSLTGLVGSLALAGLAAAATPAKVTICHFPPGNSANFQTITIAPSALPAHLAHHDFGGPCENDCALFGSICDDGNDCTVDTCNADGTCAHSAPTNCDDGNPCTADSCNPSSGACVNTPVSTSTTCNDGNACTGPDRCDSTGQCHGAAIPGCCTANAACNDQNPCTTDTCNLATHTCVNTARTCPASDLCHRASCAPDDGSCVEAPIDCDDGSVCTADTCNPATGACGHQSLSCDDGDACTTDAACDPTNGCAHTPIACGAGQTCVAGSCVATCPCATNYDAAFTAWTTTHTPPVPLQLLGANNGDNFQCFIGNKAVCAYGNCGTSVCGYETAADLVQMNLSPPTPPNTESLPIGGSCSAFHFPNCGIPDLQYGTGHSDLTAEQYSACVQLLRTLCAPN